MDFRTKPDDCLLTDVEMSQGLSIWLIYDIPFLSSDEVVEGYDSTD